MLAINTQLSAEQRLSKNITQIMGNPKYVALAGVLMIGKKGIKDDCPTAYTNGRDDYYGRAFVDGLTDSEFRFLILHETYHKLFKHLTTWQHLYKDNAQLANMACDYVINLMITDENRDLFAVMPKDAEGNNIGLLDEKFRNMDTAQVYKILKQEQEESGGGGEGDEESEESEGDEGASGGTGAGGGLDEHDWEGAQDMSEDEQRGLAREIDEAIRQGAMTAGKVGSGGNRAIDQLLQPEVNWREVMREFITETCRGNDDSTWRQPSRRHLAMGILRPSGITERVGELVIAIDTSGSIGQQELTKCLSEIKGVCDMVKPESIRILYWDTKVCSDELYGDVPNACASLEQLTQTTKPAGGGGTNVQCVTDYIRDNNINAQAVIVLTDGYLGGDWGAWTMPLLWGILDNKSARPTIGKTLHINL
jgi:predicted metal-dependent peptidase